MVTWPIADRIAFPFPSKHQLVTFFISLSALSDWIPFIYTRPLLIASTALPLDKSKAEAIKLSSRSDATVSFFSRNKISGSQMSLIETISASRFALPALSNYTTNQPFLLKQQCLPPSSLTKISPTTSLFIPSPKTEPR